MHDRTRKGWHPRKTIPRDDPDAAKRTIVQKAAMRLLEVLPPQRQELLSWMCVQWVDIAIGCGLGEVAAHEQVGLLAEYVLDFLAEIELGGGSQSGTA